MANARLRTVDAFTDSPFTGNPAAVVMLDETPADAWMAAVARETNLSDTAFVIREARSDADFRLRWCTPTVEVDLCGHATLASAHRLFEDGVQRPVRFATRSGVLTVSKRADGSLAMDFAAGRPHRSTPTLRRRRRSVRRCNGTGERTTASSCWHSLPMSVRSGN